MKKVLLRAPLLTNSGYGVHSRQVFSWLYSKKDVELTVECLQWGKTSWILNSEHENGLVGKIMECSREVKKGDYDISFQVQLPDEWDPQLAKINVGVTAAVETDKCTQKWVDACKAGFNSTEHLSLTSSFDYSGPLTETVLMGNIAIRSYMLRKERADGNPQYIGRKKLEWDGNAMKIKNLEAANQFVRRDYRQGWELT